MWNRFWLKDYKAKLLNSSKVYGNHCLSANFGLISWETWAIYLFRIASANILLLFRLNIPIEKHCPQRGTLFCKEPSCDFTEYTHLKLLYSCHWLSLEKVPIAYNLNIFFVWVKRESYSCRFLPLYSKHFAQAMAVSLTPFFIA